MSPVRFRPEDLTGILQAAGKLAESFRTTGLRVIRKDDRTPVTEADRAVSAFLRKQLQSLEPAAAWLCEEDQADSARLETDQCWIVDPLDGTQEFIAGIPEYAVSISLVYGASPVAAGVVNPATGEGGIWMDGTTPVFWGYPTAPQPRQISSCEECRIVVSRGEIERGTARHLVTRFAGVRGVGSAAYKLLRVAAGQDDLYVSMEPKSEWDVCGGVGLLQGAQKTYRLFSGGPVRFNQPCTRIRTGAAGGRTDLVDWFFAQLRAMPASSNEALSS